MGIGPGVEDHAAALDTSFLYPIHQSALMIGLLERDSEPMRLCSRSYGFLDIVQGIVAIDLRFAGAQEVEIGTVQDIYRESL
jgi:hypothetical protein